MKNITVVPNDVTWLHCAGCGEYIPKGTLCMDIDYEEYIISICYHCISKAKDQFEHYHD